MTAFVRPGLSRRQWLAGAAALGASSLLPRAVLAATPSPLLTVATRTIEVKKRAATVFGILGANGKPGLEASEGARLSGLVHNATKEPLILHFHGQVLYANDQDRARTGGGETAPGALEPVDFPLTTGTHWMHSHLLSEQQLLAAPLITREMDAPAIREVVIMLHDFAFRSPAEIMAELGGASAHGAHGAAADPHAGHAGHGAPAAAPADPHAAHMAGAMSGMVHANDVRYDAFLANDRSFDDPEVVRVDKGEKVRLRIINGATATAFILDTGRLAATCIAVDGSPCQAHAVQTLPLAQGQRVDLVVEIPRDGGAFPIVAQVEAATQRTGIVLATAGAKVARIGNDASRAAAHADLGFDLGLAAAAPLPPPSAPARAIHIMLGEEPGYRWTLNGKTHGEHTPLAAKSGERLEIMFMNPTSMMHPMHLHGHHFQVVEVNGLRFSGPVRDTVIVPPRTMVTVAVDAGAPGSWYLHCHHLYHMATGMMTELVVS
ncbi:MAG: multicopper oxidase domain-containing protein [Hyphomicrobiaceae bacterium]|nr:multicopper oxidase domain-containing protein [Hyphomicrobiaceae bacterium]